MEEGKVCDSSGEEIVLDHERLPSIASPKELDNASLRLLNLDYLSYMLLSSEQLLISSSLNLSRRRNGMTNSISSDPSNSEIDRNVRNVDKLLEHKRLYFKTSAQVRGEFASLSQKERSKLNAKRWHIHHFLSHSRSTKKKIKVKSESAYEFAFYELENYVIKSFLIHPTSGSIGRGMAIEEDGTMSDTCFSYLRSYERALYVLAQKARCYTHISILFLIILLRNIRRLVHHFKLSPTLVDLIILNTEGINLTQTYLHNLCNNNHAVKRTSLEKSQPDISRNDSLEKEPNAKMLDTLCKNCNGYKQNVHIKCQNALKEILCRKETSDDEEENTVEPAISDNEPLVINNEHEAFDQTLASSNMSERDFNFETSLNYDKGDILNINTLDFNITIEDFISKWIEDLCKFGSICNKICPKPTFLENPILKLTFNSSNFATQKLCKYPYNNNLSLHRDQRIRKLMVYLPEVPREESTTSNQTEAMTPVKTSPLRRASNPTTITRMTLRSHESMNGGEKITTSTKYNRWKKMEERTLVDAINQHGTGKWSFFSKMYFSGKKTALQLKDKWCNLLRFQHVQLVTDKSKRGIKSTGSWQFVDTK